MAANRYGFTLIEILVVCAVISILFSLGVIAYQGVQKRSAEAIVFKDLKSASEQLGLQQARVSGRPSNITELPADFRPSEGVIVRLASGYDGPYYYGLSEVQNGVLLSEVCEELIADPLYSTIHAREGGQTQSVVMSCSHDTGGNRMQITGWDSKKWYTPVTRSDIQAYIDSVPYDDWWTDRQDVVRGFYYELMNRFEQRGGSFPVESFWDPWATQWSGTLKEDLPPPSAPPAQAAGSYCVEAYHRSFPDEVFYITEKDIIEPGTC